MHIASLALRHYRNYEALDVSFSPAMNVFIGQNAQGKTNLMEAIHTLALTKSHRTANDRELICFQQEEAIISGKIIKSTATVPLELSISRKGKKAKVNHLEQKKLSQYIGNFNVVLFAPEDLYMVKGAPAFRRKFIDMELGQMNPIYLFDLVQYQKVLKQRNHYLKQMMFKRQNDTVYLDVLTEQLAILGAKLLKHRLAFVAQLEKWAMPLHQQLTQGKELLSLSYQSSLPLTQEMDENDIFYVLVEKYQQQQQKEIEQGTTLYGPHRDDLLLLVDKRSVQLFGSQGQQRTVVLSLKLAEIELMREMTQEYPTLLLDDVLSELDDYRQTFLFQSIQKGVQTFLTTTSLESIDPEQLASATVFHIENGKIKESE